MCIRHGSKLFSHEIGFIVLSILLKKKMRHRDYVAELISGRMKSQTKEVLFRSPIINHYTLYSEWFRPVFSVDLWSHLYINFNGYSAQKMLEIITKRIGNECLPAVISKSLL